VAFVRERRTAEEMAQVLLKKSSKRLLHVACGPLMLDKWRNYKAGEDLITAVNSIAKAALTLEIYLSSIGIGYTMVKDMKPPFYEESVPVLQDLLKTERNNNLAKDLLAEALIERSKLLIGVSDFENAVALLEQATTYKREEAIIKSLSDAATKYARALLDDETNIQKAIDLLERLRSKFSISDYEFKAQLSISYFTRGAVASHKNQYQSSLNDIRTALQIDPQNEAAKKYMVRALENRARELSNESKYNEAIALMNEAIAYDSEQVSSALIASILFGRGIDRANAAIQAHSSYTAYRTRQELNAALEDLQTALKLDPANASHIQNQINALRISLSRL
jgi:tetratricopeptide (TPR) repeat protein